MSRPPSPYAYVSDPMYWLWLGAKEAIPGVRLGGIYSDTTGYHNTRRRLLTKAPNSYSIRLDMDKKGSADLASGLDLTMGDAEMRRRTNYLRSSDLHPDDNRLRALREFIGTRDGEHVYCRIAGNEGLGQRHGVYDSTRDDSHLWHIHLSVLRAFAASWAALEPVLSVLAGETWEQWQARKGDDVTPEELLRFDPNDTSTGIRNRTWRHDVDTNKTVQFRFAVENTWDKAHRAEEAITSQVLPLLETLAASRAGCSVEEMREMLRTEFDRAVAQMVQALRDEVPALAESLAGLSEEEIGEALARWLAGRLNAPQS